MALMLWTRGTLLSKTGEIMGRAGGRLKENAVVDEDVVVQIEVARRSEARPADVGIPAFTSNNSG